MTGWERLKDVLNSYPEESLVTRQSLLTDLCNFWTESTTDNVRRQLVVCGFLADTKCAGVYKVIGHIPYELSMKGLRKRYDDIMHHFGYVDEIQWYEKSWSKFCKMEV